MSVLSRRRFAGGLVAAVVALGVAACTGPASSISTDKNTAAGASRVDVAIGYNNNQNWDPLNTGSAFVMSAENHIYEPLWDAEAVTRKPFAALATTLPSADQQKQPVWTVKLRQGATWQDGQPVTADDVVWTFGRILDPNKKLLTTSFFASWLDSVTKVDDSTVKITMKNAFPYALQRFAIVKIMPKHVFDGQSDDFLKQGKNALGSGPYKVTAQQDGSFTTLTRYDKYNGPLKPTFQTMQWNASVDPAARTALLTAGSDGVQIADNIPQDSIETLKAKGLTVEGQDSMNMLGLAFNTSKPPFDNKLVREALRYAIDTNKLIQVSIGGQGTPAKGFLQESSPYFKAASTQYTYDPEKAKALLKQAGVTTPISIRLMSTNISWTKVAVNTIKEGWDAIGVNTTLDVMETAQFNSKLASGEPADVVTFSGNPNQFGQDPDLNIRWFYSTTGQFLPWNKWSTTPDYKALDSLLTQSEQAADPAQAGQLVDQAMDMIAEQGVIYPVMHMKLFTAWNPKALSGVKPLDIPGVNLLTASRVG